MDITSQSMKMCYKHDNDIVIVSKFDLASSMNHKQFNSVYYLLPNQQSVKYYSAKVNLDTDFPACYLRKK